MERKAIHKITHVGVRIKTQIEIPTEIELVTQSITASSQEASNIAVL
jgi:hypothetical protein